MPTYDKDAITEAMKALVPGGVLTAVNLPSIPKIRKYFTKKYDNGGRSNDIFDVRAEIKNELLSAGAVSEEKQPTLPLPQRVVDELEKANVAFADFLSTLGMATNNCINEEIVSIRAAADQGIAYEREKALATTEDAIKEAREIGYEVDELIDEIDEIKARFAETKNDLTETKESLAAVTATSDLLSIQLTETKASLDEERAKHEMTKAEAARAQAEVSRLMAESAATQKDVVRITTDCENLADNTIKITEALNAAKNQVDAEKARANQLMAERDAAKATAADERTRAENAMAEVAKAQAEVARIGAELKAELAKSATKRKEVKANGK